MRRLREEWGASAVEYALIIAAVAALLIPIAISLEGVVQQVLGDSCVATAKENGMSDAAAAAAC